MKRVIGNKAYLTALKIVMDMVRNPNTKGIIYTTDKEFTKQVKLEVKRLLATMGIDKVHSSESQ